MRLTFLSLALLAFTAPAAAAEVLEVNFEITNGCEIGPISPVEFGTANFIDNDIQVTASVDIRCTSGVEYRWFFDGGDAQTGARLMDPTSAGVNGSVTYYITRDAAAQFVISQAQPVESTGTGTWQTHPFYARLPRQTTPYPDTYRDVLDVVVEF